MSKPTVNVLGWYGKGNVGDESYKLSFPLVYPQYRFKFSDRITDPNSPSVLGGGDVVNSATLAQLSACRGRRSIASVSISSQSNAKAFDGIDNVVVRDGSSLRRMEEIGVSARYAPDFAFALQPDPKAGAEKIKNLFYEGGLDRYERVVTVVTNAHLVCEQTARQAAVFDKLSHDLQWVCDNTSASFLFVPFGSRQPWDDRVPNGWIASKCKFWKKNCVVYSPLDPQTALNVISASDAVVSMRLHASIFSTVAGVPFVDVTHNHKNAGYLDTIGRRDWSMPFDDFNGPRCKKRLELFFGDGGYGKGLLKIVEKEQSTLKEMSRHVPLV